MRAGHQEIMVPDYCFCARAGSTMHLDVLPDDVVVTDAQKALLPFIGQILRRIPQHSARVNLVAGTDLSPAADIRVAQDAGSGTDFHRAINHDVGTDFRLRVDLRARIDYGRAMNSHWASCVLWRCRPCLPATIRGRSVLPEFGTSPPPTRPSR